MKTELSELYELNKPFRTNLNGYVLDLNGEALINGRFIQWDTHDSIDTYVINGKEKTYTMKEISVYHDMQKLEKPYVSRFYDDSSGLDELRKTLIMFQNVPKGAKIINTENFEKYEGKLVGGWLRDSMRSVYGFLNGYHSMPGYSLGIAWEIPEQEMKELTTYEW